MQPTLGRHQMAEWIQYQHSLTRGRSSEAFQGDTRGDITDTVLCRGLGRLGPHERQPQTMSSLAFLGDRQQRSVRLEVRS